LLILRLTARTVWTKDSSSVSSSAWTWRTPCRRAACRSWRSPHSPPSSPRRPVGAWSRPRV